MHFSLPKNISLQKSLIVSLLFSFLIFSFAIQKTWRVSKPKCFESAKTEVFGPKKKDNGISQVPHLCYVIIRPKTQIGRKQFLLSDPNSTSIKSQLTAHQLLEDKPGKHQD